MLHMKKIMGALYDLPVNLRSDKTESRLARRRFSKKMNERICFFLLWKAKKQKNKFIRLFFGRIYGAQICLQFYLTFRKND